MRVRLKKGLVLANSWTVLRAIGEGGTADVYEVRGSCGGRFAAKVLRHDLAEDAGWRRRFEREVKLLRKLAHPSLPLLYEAGTMQLTPHSVGRPFLVMELLRGQALSQRCGTPATESEVINWLQQSLDAIAAVHAAGVVHRDIKPSNLFLTESGTLKVLDFGIAGYGSRADGNSTAGLLGTPAFMPPEQARGRWNEVDARSDLWALGAVAFTLLSGRSVHPAGTTNEQLALAMCRSALPLRAAAPWVSERLALVVDRALAYDPAMRWQSAHAFLDGLRGRIALESFEPKGDRTWTGCEAGAPGRPRSHHARLFAVLGVAAAAGIVAARARTSASEGELGKRAVASGRSNLLAVEHRTNDRGSSTPPTVTGETTTQPILPALRSAPVQANRLRSPSRMVHASSVAKAPLSEAAPQPRREPLDERLPFLSQGAVEARLALDPLDRRL